MKALQLVLCSFSVSLFACGPLPGSPCDIEEHATRLAGAALVDCGRFTNASDPAAGTACALDAQRAGRPFVLRYEQQGREAVVATYFVRTADGRSAMFFNDPAPCGNTSCGPEIRGYDCSAFGSRPGSDGRTYLDCSDTSASRTVCRMTW